MKKLRKKSRRRLITYAIFVKEFNDCAEEADMLGDEHGSNDG
jgi:hypothetical protein